MASLLGIDAADRPNRTLQFGHIEVVVDDNFSVPTQDESTTASGLSGGYDYQSSTDTGTTTDTTEATPDQGAPIGGGGVPCVN